MVVLPVILYIMKLLAVGLRLATLTVEMLAQFIFLRILRRALDLQKCDVSENYYHYGTNRTNWYVRENVTLRICHPGLDARKFCCAKISTFTVLLLKV